MLWIKSHLPKLLIALLITTPIATLSPSTAPANAATFDCAWTDTGATRALGIGNAAAADHYRTISKYCRYFESSHPVCVSQFNRARALYGSDFIANLPTIYVLIVDYANACATDRDAGGGSGGVSANNGGCRSLKGFSAAPTPKISGTVKTTQVLTVKKGTWKPSPDEFGYRWYRNGVEIPDAVEPQFRVTAADVGKRITVKVTAFKRCVKTKGKQSSATSKVALQVRPYATDMFSLGGSRTGVRPNLSVYQTWFHNGNASFANTVWTLDLDSEAGFSEGWADSYASEYRETGEPEFYMPVYRAAPYFYRCNFAGTAFVNVRTQAIPDASDYRDGWRATDLTFDAIPLTCGYAYDSNLANPIRWTDSSDPLVLESNQ